MSVLRSLLPGALVLAAAVASTALVDDATLAGLTDTYGLVLTGAGLALSWVFHRSRAFLVLCLLAWLGVVVGEIGGALTAAGGVVEAEGAARGLDIGDVGEGAGLLAYGTVVIGLLALVGLMRDRGILSHVGGAQLLGVGGIAAVGHLVLSDPELFGALVATPELAPLADEAAAGLPMATVAAAGVAALVLAIGVQRYRGPVERALVWCLVSLVVALLPSLSPAQAGVFVTAAALTLTLGVVEASYVMAYRDELTGLPGRRALMQYLGGIQGLYTVAMVDVDHFKKFNDKHGHDVGDQVLKLVASRLGKAPGGGKAYRYGGEEFTLIFPGRAREDAEPHLEAVRASVEASRFSMRSWRRPRKKPEQPKKTKKERAPKKLSVTVSIGAADSGAESDPEAVIKLADEALYRAKKKGRNQVSP